MTLGVNDLFLGEFGVFINDSILFASVWSSMLGDGILLVVLLPYLFPMKAFIAGGVLSSLEDMVNNDDILSWFAAKEERPLSGAVLLSIFLLFRLISSVSILLVDTVEFGGY